MRKLAEDLIKLCKNEWSIEISSNALDTLKKRWNKSVYLPAANDTQIHQAYLKSKLKE